MSEQLKSCPFCGKTHALTVDNLAGDDWYVECGACKVQQHAIYPTSDAAIAAWNTRADDAALSRLRDTQRVLVEALRRFLAAHPYANDGRDGFSVVVTREQVAACRAARAALASVEQQPNSDHLTPAGDEEVTAREAARYLDALVWALGAHDTDGFRERCVNEGAYWWRKELAERAGLVWDGERYVRAAMQEPSEDGTGRELTAPEKMIEAAAQEPSEDARDAARSALDELRAAFCAVRVVGSIDNHHVIRRASVIDLIDRRRAAMQEPKP